MSKRFNISISGTPPFPLLARQLVQDEDFKQDTQKLLSLPEPEFESLAQALQGHETFLDRTLFDQIVTERLAVVEGRAEIADMVWRLAELLRSEDGVNVEKTFAILRDTINEKLEDADEGQRDVLIQRIERLSVRPKGFDLQHKALRLKDATAKELDDIQIICDIRPVFDQERSRIEGAIVVTTLRIDFEDTAKESSLEIRLTDDELKSLEEKVVAATRKVELIRDLLHSKSITIAKSSTE